jgi:hypothetical protein
VLETEGRLLSVKQRRLRPQRNGAESEGGGTERERHSQGAGGYAAKLASARPTSPSRKRFNARSRS